MRGVVYCDACGCSNPSGLKKCQTCSATMNVVRSNPITSADFANRKMAIFDIDNTILDPEQRFIDARRAGIIDKDGAPKSKGGWKKRGEFLYKEDRLLKDRVMDNSMDLIEHLMESGYVIAYCTARPFAHYEATKYQLEQKGFPLFQNGAGEDLLFCKRSMGQKTPLYKKGVVETLQAQYDVRLFFDDQPENLAAALQADVPGVYASVQEYYGMIKGVKSNGTLNMRGGRAEDPDAEMYLPGSDSMGRTYLDQERRTPKTTGNQKTLKEFNNPSMYSKKSLEMAYESIKGTKIQTEPGPGMKMCGTCAYMCQKSAKCKKWTEIKGEPVYVVADWYCGAWKQSVRGNPVKRGSDSKGSYYRWGKNQKYYYKTGSKTSRENARKKAHNQAKAAFAGGYQGKYNPGHGGGIPDEIEGKHCILELYDCDPKLLNDEKFIRKTMKSAAKGANMQLLDFVSHEFDPQGVTALALLGESHMSIHTWPELGYAMVDVLTCGEKSRPEEACEIICKKLQADNHTLKLFMRETPAYHEMARQNPEEYSSDYMVPRDVDTLGKAADRIEDTYYEGLEVPEWWKSKMSVTADKADSLADAISYVADNPSQILKIYSGEPKSKFRNMGVVFAEVQIGRNIAKDVGEVVQSVYRGLIGGRTSMAERRMAMAIASMQKELSDRATDAGGNAIANLKVDYEIVQGTATLTIIAHADAIKMARKPKSNPPRSNPPKSKVDKGKELYKHMNGKDPEKTEIKKIDMGDVWYQVGEGGCWEIGYMSGKETGSAAQKYRHTFNEETKNGDFPKLYATIPDKGKPMLIITGGTWKIKTDEDGVAWIYD